MSIIASYMVPHPPMIVPQIGRGSEERVRKTIDAYNQVADEIAGIKPDTIIISSPHSIMYADYFHISPGKSAFGNFSGFGVPEVKFHETYDWELVERICLLANESGLAAGTLGERDASLDHGTMVPLYFIRQKYNDFNIIRIGLSGQSLYKHYELGKLIKQAISDLDRRAVYVASGDLSHKLQDYGPYGYAPEGPTYDERIMKVCSSGEFDKLFDFDEEFCDKAAECGHRSFVMMAGALDGNRVIAKELSHEDVTGVGYGICTFSVETDSAGAPVYDPEREFLRKHLNQKKSELTERYKDSDEYVRLALKSLESYILNHRKLSVSEGVSGFSDEAKTELLNKQAGAFVSIHEHGRLRGCIGTILPTCENVAQEIINNAISASTRDPRFEPIESDELPFLEVNVDVLGEPEPIDSMDELDPKRYGVIVSKGRRRGLLLPDLDGVDTVEQQVSIARQKAGIDEFEDVSLERFEVVRHI
ncbi:MAG: AmmeMemoRadiSam system protein A [Lachnospiraceae bacterium]|nr:AmmeMemoRadiSam system protein A [Lachnospiraceae bacterium]